MPVLYTGDQAELSALEYHDVVLPMLCSTCRIPLLQVPVTLALAGAIEIARHIT